jgi:hypothetical protein
VRFNSCSAVFDDCGSDLQMNVDRCMCTVVLLGGESFDKKIACCPFSSTLSIKQSPRNDNTVHYATS